jgi:ankyrin repeat protein
MHETYERLLRDVGETNIENVRRIMTLLCYSNRLLTVEEVCHALTVDLQKPPCLDLDSKVLTENGLRKICGNLIEISQREIYPGLVAPVVNVAHSLVQEYLESNAIRRQEMAAFALERGSANRELAQICLVYLKLALSDETRGNRRLEKFPLALFSALEWFNYYAACPDKDSGLQNLAFDLFHDGKGGCFTSWIELHDVDSTWGIRSYADAGQVLNHKGAPLYYASLLGLEEVADKIIATGSDVNAQGGRHGNALWAASLKGHTAVVKILLSHQADVNFQNGELGTALQVASLKGHTGVVHALLSYQAEVNIQSGEYGTALQAASCKGHKEIVQALLNYKADVNAQGGRYGSALKMATDHDHKEVVQMLLECGAHPSHRDLSEELRAASVQGDENKVDELLNVGHGYSNDQLQDAKDTALVLVSCHCHEIAVRLLLKKGANVNARPAKFGNTALFGASWTQRDAVLWTTYQFWLKIDVEDPAIRRLATRIAPETSMMNALIHREGSSQQVFEILSTLVMDDLSTKGCLPGKEHLNISFEDSEKVVEILLENGADVNAQGGYYGNALQAASHIGNEKVVKMLLQYGANVNVQGGYYGNALQAASYLGNEKVVKMLLQYGADVNAQGGYYGSARNAASVKGHQGVEQILRDHQARIDGVNGAAPAEITP